MNVFRPAAFVVVLTALLSAPARADVRLPRIFTNDMMLQRDQPIPVWGWADPGETLTVTLAGNTANATADAEGRWTVALPPLTAGENLDLEVRGKNAITLKNLIVGDIWLCSGQSNMEWQVAACDGADDIKAADLPKIRRIKFNHVTGPDAVEDAATATPWQVCSPQTAGGFTGCGFYFAREIVAKTGVPIGLLDDNWGGTAIEPWITPEGVASVPALAAVAAERQKARAAWRQQLPKALAEHEVWIGRTRAALANDGPIPAVPPLPADPGANGWFSIANAMIRPVQRLPIKGVLWYQGESNGGEGESYFHKMQALVAGWRQAWNRPEMPFYYVQLASFQQPTDNPAGGDGWAKLREAQLRALSIPHTGMVVAIDTVPLAVANDIHPKNKYDLGLRLARWALQRDYGKADIVPSGPLYTGMRAEGGKIRLSFDHVGAGLMVGTKSGREPAVEERAGKLRRFAIAGADQKWVWADAVIDGSTVVVSSPEVAEPVAVRYAFTMNPDGANLYNREGLPASPFRTDAW